MKNNTWKSVQSFGRKAAIKTLEVGQKVVNGAAKCAAVAAVAGAVVLGGATPAKADGLSIAPLTSAITSNITVAEGLLATGFLVTALFIGVKIIRKGAAKVG